MARKMAQTVVLRNPDTGAPEAIVAGQECPAWAEKVITNEDVFEAAKREPEKASRRRPAGQSDDE